MDFIVGQLLCVHDIDARIVVISIYVDDCVVNRNVEIESKRGLLMHELKMKEWENCATFLVLRSTSFKYVYGYHKDNVHWICDQSMVWLNVRLSLCFWIRI